MKSRERLLTHDSIISREKRKYGKEWLTLTEVKYGDFIFDLVAINLQTKQVEIIEVDFTTVSSKEKIEYAKTLGKVKIFRPMSERGKIRKKNYQTTINALANRFRMGILESLVDKGTLTYSELCSLLGLNFARDGGQFAYHLNRLLRTGLIKKNNNGKYKISRNGRKIINFFRKFDNFNKKKKQETV